MKMKKKIVCILLMCFIVMAYHFPVHAVNKSVQAARNGVVRVISIIQTAEGSGSSIGSGFAIGREGEPVSYFVTNNHVINGASNQIFIVLESLEVKNSVIPAQVVQTWTTPDLAILKIENPITDRSALPLLTAGSAEVTQSVYALGFPGISDNLNDNRQSYPSTIEDITVTSGTITKKETELLNTTCVQIDAGIHAGNSGGPLVNENGEVIGINTYSARNNDGTTSEGMNCSIYVDYVMRYCDSNNIPYYQLSTSTIAGPDSEKGTDSGQGSESGQGAEPEQGKETRQGKETEQDTDYVYYIIIAFAAVLGIGINRSLRKKRYRTNRKSTEYSPSNNSETAPQILPNNTAGAVGDLQGMNQPNVQGSKELQVTGINGCYAGNSFPVKDKIIMGRSAAQCNIVFPAKTAGVSSLHCELRNVSGHIELMDRGSTYGTFLGNGTKLEVNYPYQLQYGDSFYLGSTENKFKVG